MGVTPAGKMGSWSCAMVLPASLAPAFPPRNCPFLVQSIFLASHKLTPHFRMSEFPFSETGRKEIAAWALGLLLEGIDLSKHQRRKRYSLPATVAPHETPSAAQSAARSWKLPAPLPASST